MKRVLSLLVPLVLFVVIPAAFAQDEGSNPNQPIPDVVQTDGSGLVAWTDMQTPEPVPAQTAPATQPSQAPTPEPRPETPAPNDQGKSTEPAQPGQSQPAQPGEAGAQPQGPDNIQAEPAAQTFTGTISKDGDNYVLQVDTSSYKLDDQDKAKEFDGQKVRVIGSLDRNTQMIHVQKIEPFS